MAAFGGIMQNKSERPRIRPELTLIDHLLRLVAVGVAISCVAYALSWYSSLPVAIPTRVDGRGQVLGTGPSWTIFLMPALGATLVFFMILLQRWPWLSNTIVEITEENALIQYRLVNRLLSLIAIEIGLIFFLITWVVIGTAMGTPKGAVAAIMVSIASWLPILGWYFWASFRAA